MNDHLNDQSNPARRRAPRKILKPRRLALLVTVAGLSMAVLVIGPGGYRQLNLPAWTAPANAAEMTQNAPGFADLVVRVKPAVISVRVRIDEDGGNAAVTQRGTEESDPDQQGSPFEQFFRGGPNGMPHRHQVITGEGSGFFISADGYAVTNNHVVDHARSVQVTTDDGTIYTAKVVGTDPKTDLALIKVDGNVIGVNTAIFSPSGGSVGIGFDIPASTAKLVVAQLRDKGFITRGWLGVQVQPVTADIADSLGMKQARGAIVDSPQANSPAAKAGIEAGDVITAVNGTEIKDSRNLARTISMMAPGTDVKLDVLHNGTSKPITLTLGEMPGDHQANAGDTQPKAVAGTPRLGLGLAPAGEGAGQKGVVVTSVDPDGPAAEHGLQTGDVILNVGGKPVANVGDVRSALVAASAGGKHTILMQVKTADAATRFVAVPLAKG